MTTIDEYVNELHDTKKRTHLWSIFDFMAFTFPELKFKIAWNQPMYSYHGTFIIGFSVAKPHIAIAPEKKGIEMFSSQIATSGYSYSSNIFRIKWTDRIDFDLLENIIRYNIKDKGHCTTFWR